jgi:hypothetical protein
MSLHGGAARMVAVAACSGAVLITSIANGAAAPTGTLMGSLPPGYSSANCQEATAPDGFVEKVTCGQNSDPAGPASAIFWLLPNTDGLAAAFQGAGTGMTVASSCPGGQVSPGTWHYKSSPDQPAGQVECGTTNSDGTEVAMVVWTDNAKLRAALIGGTDMASLYQWWSTKSG